MCFSEFFDLPKMSVKTIEEGVITAWRDVYAPYVRYTGKHIGWGKTCDRSITHVFSTRNASRVGGGPEFFDTIFPNEGIGMQTKTGKETDVVTIGRQTGATIRDRIEGMKRKIATESKNNGCVESWMLLINTTTLVASIYHLTTWDGRSLKLIGNFLSEDAMRIYNGGATQFELDTTKLTPIHTFKLPDVDFSEHPIILSRVRINVSKLSIPEIIEAVREGARRAEKTIKHIEDTMALKSDFGDKGDLFEHLVKKFLVENYIGFDFKSYKLTDLSVPGKVMFQIKRNAEEQGQIIYCRSSVKVENRSSDVLSRIEAGFKRTNAKQYVMIESRVKSINAFRLATLSDQNKVETNGTFLTDGNFKSDGGKERNQSHFRINLAGLEVI